MKNKKRWFDNVVGLFGAVNYVDAAGGTIGDGDGGGEGDGGNDGDLTGGAGAGSGSGSDDSGDGTDGKGADDGSGTDDDKSGSDDGTGDGKGASDGVEAKFTELSNKFDRLVEKLSTGDSSDDGSDGKSKLSGLEQDDLVALMADDPEGFINKLTESVEKSVSEKVAADNANRSYDTKVEATINDYADKNKDFEEMWDKGEIQAYIEDNPGHNAISAHMAMTMEAKIEAASKTGEETAIKNFRAKANNQVLGDGPGIAPEQRDAALQNTSKFGGRSAVIAARAGLIS